MHIMAPMSTYWCTFVPTYIDGNIIFRYNTVHWFWHWKNPILISHRQGQVGAACMATTQRSRRGRKSQTKLTRQWLGRERKTHPLPPLSKILNNSKRAAQSAAVFDIPSGASLGQVRWKFEGDQYEIFELGISIFYVTTGRFRSKSAKCLENS